VRAKCRVLSVKVCGMCNYYQAMKGETFRAWYICLGTEIMLGWNISVSRRFNSQMAGNRSTAVPKTILDDPLQPATPGPHFIV